MTATPTPRPAPAASRRSRRSRGATIVEAAIVFPIVMLFSFGILEWGMAMKNVNTTSAAAREGARAFSTLPRSALAPDAAKARVEKDLSALSNGTPLLLYLYRANPLTGLPCSDTACTGSGTLTPGGCPSEWCLQYQWNTGTRRFDLTSGSWPPSSQYACPDGPMSVGVYVTVRHSFVTGFFGASRTLAERAMARLEPLPRNVCGAT